MSCQGTVPAALVAFLDADSYEETVRNAVSLGGDSDTLACIAGGIAEAFYGGVPEAIRAEVRVRLPPDLSIELNKRCKNFRLSPEEVAQYHIERALKQDDAYWLAMLHELMAQGRRD